MRKVLLAVVCTALVVVAGCASKEGAKGTDAQNGNFASTPTGSIVIAPDKALSGRVVKVNPNGGFLVISFSPGQMPAKESVMVVYRGGYKVAEVRISGPQLEDNIVADIISGEVLVGDQVRENYTERRK